MASGDTMARNRPLREEHYILDCTGTRLAEYEYVQQGSAEGWLVYIHGMRDYRGVVCHTYRFIEKE